MSGKFTLIIEHDDNGYYGYCPELKGCQTQGDNYEETEENLREAVALYLETLTNDEKQILFKKEIKASFHEVEFA